MKQNRLYLVCLCAVLGLSFTGCGEDSDQSGCSPTTAEQDCGDPTVFYCDAMSKSCKRFIPAHCLNGKTDTGLETAEDCGGACVSEAYVVAAQNIDYRQTCNVGKTCIVNDDCKSGICEGNVCKDKPCETKSDCSADETCENNTCVSCTDGKKNQDETDVDCGGICTTYADPKRCEVGKPCTVPNDCISGSCVNNLCAQAEFAVADPARLIINELQDVSKSTPPFALNENATACEFIEIANPDDAGYKLDGIKLAVQREDKEGSFEIDLSNNIIQPKSLIVIHNCASLPLPETVVSIKSDELAIVGSGTYSFTLVSGEKSGSPVKIKFAQYASSYNREIDFDPNANMNKTTAIGKNAAAATPGYCLNGGLYHEGCITHCANGTKDEDESGVDCGGELCEKCQDEGECKDYKDCAGGFCYKDPKAGTTDDKGVYHEPEYGVCEICEEDEECKQPKAVCKKDPILDENGDPTGKTNNYCAVPETCSDKTLNQDETDTDCGGICGSTCRIGQVCGSGADCMSTVCEDGKCGGTDPAKADVTALVINEIYDSATSRTPLFTLNRNNKSCEFVEIANISDNNVSLEGVKLVIKKTNKVETPKEIKLNGALDAKKILLVHSCKDNLLDYPQSDARILYNSSFLTKENTYNLYLEDDAGNTSHAVNFNNNEKDYSTSMNHQTDFEPTSEMVPTTSISGAAAFATPGYCVNGGLYSLNCQNYCADTILNGNESAADCGGNCSPCELGKSCSIYSDCLSGVCKGNVCSKCSDDKQCETGSCNTGTGNCESEPTCTDKIKNQDETDVDCGGSCGACNDGKVCKDNKDCISGNCASNTCTPSTCAEPNAGDIIISEIYNNASGNMPMIDGSEQPASEYIELVNLTDKELRLSGANLSLLRTDNDKGDTINIPLSGCIPAHQAVIISGTKINSLPDGVENLVALSAEKNAIVNTAIYTTTLSYQSTTIHSVKDPDKPKAGISYVVSNESVCKNDEVLTLHNEINPNLKLSPGYCANGGLFSEKCAVEDTCSNGKKDGTESDIDCGGTCTLCGKGKHCESNSDCESGFCDSNKCAIDECEQPSEGDISITEVLNNAKVSAEMSVYDKNATGASDQKQVEFAEIVNLTNKKLSLNTLKLETKRFDTEAVTSFNLSGCIEPKNAAVISADVVAGLPEGVINVLALGGANKFTNSKRYSYSLINSSGVIISTAVEAEDAKFSEGVSHTSEDHSVTKNAPLKDHNKINSVLKHSPGYCANGKLFKDNCL